MGRVLSITFIWGFSFSKSAAICLKIRASPPRGFPWMNVISVFSCPCSFFPEQAGSSKGRRKRTVNRLKSSFGSLRTVGKNKCFTAKCQMKPGHFAQTGRRASGHMPAISPCLKGRTGRRRQDSSLNRPKNSVFLQKRSKKLKKVLDKPARVLYSPAVNRKE